MRTPTISEDGRTITVEQSATLLTRPAFGVWCPSCATASACEALAATEFVDGAPMVVVNVRSCGQCGWRKVDAA